MGPSGFITVLAGWVTTEVGRQPWTVYGHLRTADSVSPVEASAVATSLIAFIVVYFVTFGAGICYNLKLMAASPEAATATPAMPQRADSIAPADSQLSGRKEP